MAWDNVSKRVAVKAIGQVESSMNYAAINYNDPITVGIGQWFGTRAADILMKMKTAAPSQWAAIDATLRGRLETTPATSTTWNSFYLSRAQGESLVPLLKAASAVQDRQIVADLEAYTSTASQYGLDYNSNTDSFILWAVAYHQSPRQALRVLNRIGGNVSLRRMLDGILADGVLGQYRNRYNTAYNIIVNKDTSGVGDISGSGGIANPGNGNPTIQQTQNVAVNAGNLIISADFNGDLRAQTKWGNYVIPQQGHNLWSVALKDIAINIANEIRQENAGNSGGNSGPPPSGAGALGAKALQWMQQRINKFAYAQAPGRLNPDSSGFTDCSGSIYRAYMDTSGTMVGTWTGDQYFRGYSVIERGRGAMSAAQKALCKPGDIIVMSWGGGYPHTDHVEMYVDSGHTIGHGGPGKGPHINNISMLSGTAWWTVRRHD